MGFTIINPYRFAAAPGGGAVDVEWFEEFTTNGATSASATTTSSAASGDMIGIIVKIRGATAPAEPVTADFTIGTVQQNLPAQDRCSIALATYAAPSSGTISVTVNNDGNTFDWNLTIINFGQATYDSGNSAAGSGSSAVNFPALTTGADNAKVLYYYAARTGVSWTGSPTFPTDSPVAPFADGGNWTESISESNAFFVRSQATAGAAPTQTITPGGFANRSLIIASFIPA